MLITDKSGNGVYREDLITRASLREKPLTEAVVVTPSDTIDLPRVASDLLVAVAGNLSFIAASNNEVINMTSVPVGRLGMAVKRVRSTGTTAAVRAIY